MNKGDLIRDFVQITRDVTRQQDRMVFVLHEVVQQVEHLIPHDRVKTARRLVKQQQLRVMRQRCRDIQLGFRALGVVPDGLFSVNAEFFDVRRKLLRIPVFVRSAEERAHLCGAHRARETAVLEHHADLFTDGRIRAMFPQHGNLAAVRPDEVEHRLDGRCLSGTVFSY